MRDENNLDAALESILLENDLAGPPPVFAVGDRAKIRSTGYTRQFHFRACRPGNHVTVRLQVFRDNKLAGYRVGLDPDGTNLDPQDERLLDWPYSIGELEEL